MPNYIELHEAAHSLARAQRILVIGCSGGGKSTLSMKLSAAFDLEYVSFDRDVRWQPGWVSRGKADQRRILERLVQSDRWVMDGTSPSTFDIRLPRTDLLIWIRVARRTALMGMAQRVLKYLGTVRPDMAAGCPERWPDREFLSYIWHFEKKSAPAIVRNLQQCGPDVPVLLLHSRREIDRLLRDSGPLQNRGA